MFWKRSAWLSQGFVQRKWLSRTPGTSKEYWRPRKRPGRICRHSVVPANRSPSQQRSLSHPVQPSSPKERDADDAPPEPGNAAPPRWHGQERSSRFLR